MHRRSDQFGYLLEVPLFIIAVIVASAVLLPVLSTVGKKVLAVSGAVVIIGCLYYLIVIPGWQPSTTSRLRWPWNLLVFLVITLLIILGTAGYVAA